MSQDDYANQVAKLQDALLKGNIDREMYERLKADLGKETSESPFCNPEKATRVVQRSWLRSKWAIAGLCGAIALCLIIFPEVRESAFRGFQNGWHKVRENWFFSQRSYLKPDYQHLLEDRNVQLCYGSNVAKDEAQRLLDYLMFHGFGEKDRTKLLCLSRRGNCILVKAPFDAKAAQDPENMKNLKAFWSRVSQDVFEGVPIEFHACDGDLRTLATISSEP